MKNIIIMMICFLTGLTVTAQDLNECLSKYSKNQEKIHSLICNGSIITKSFDNAGKSMYDNESRIMIYLKKPDMFKMTMLDPVKSEIIQKKGFIKQDLGDMGSSITPVTEENDMFANFLGQNIFDQKIISSEYLAEHVSIDGQQLTKFKFSTADNNVFNIYFNADSLLVRTEAYANNTLISQSVIEYSNVDGIYITSKMETTVYENGMTMSNIIEYTDISVNIKILDKEFD